MNKIIIRKERKEDYKQTEHMVMRAFWNLHGPGCNEHLLIHKLRASDCYLPELSRVAEMNGKIVGAIFYSKAIIQDGDIIHEVLTFGPLCVEPLVQDLGVGGRLLRETMQLAKEEGYPGICIFGEPDYYPKHGFLTCDHFGITDWAGKNYAPFMGYELQEGAFQKIHGRFREDAVFENCEDEVELEEFNKQFLPYPKLKLSCQWFHEQRLGRISEVQKNTYTIQYWEKEFPAKLNGSFYKEGQEFPVVGDYVTFDYNPYGEARIVSLCERKSVLKRPDATIYKEQVMVSNFDYVFIVSSLNNEYNLNRIARYVSVTLQGNGIPVVILTKADLCEDPMPYIKEIEGLSDKVFVHVVSSVTGQGLKDLQSYMQSGKTIVLTGSSGVGKSTLLNALAGENRMKTGEIRRKDSKGRHTTTYRQLITLENGVTIIDTPGMRELGMCDVEEGIEDTFSDIVELEGQCKFRNCAHKSEPGCAIKQALEEGSLSEERWKLYQGLQKESKRGADMRAIAKQRRVLKTTKGKF